MQFGYVGEVTQLALLEQVQIPIPSLEKNEIDFSRTTSIRLEETI